ncbi:MAG: hypothetical protein ACJ71S_06350 [Acidobacteriaceae bacterium]
MPKLTWEDLLFAALIPAAQIWLLVWTVRRGVSRLWLALCTTLIVSALGGTVSVVLLLTDAVTGRTSGFIPTAYFYSFWYCALAVAGLQIWLLWEIVSRITGCSDRPWLRWAFAVIAVSAALGAVAISHHARTPLFVHPVMRIVTVIDRTIWLAWCLLFLGLTVSADLVGLKWRRQIIGISLGFVVQAVAGTSYSWLLTSANTATLDALSYSAWIVSIAIWAFALRESPLLLLTPALEAAFESSLRQLETTRKEVHRTCL